MKILLSGCNGRMGEAITRRLSKKHLIVAGVSRSSALAHCNYPVYTTLDEVKETFDIVIDFSVAENAKAVIAYVKKVKKPLVMGTTGLHTSDEASLKELSGDVAILFSHNTSFGVTILLHLLEVASGLLSLDYDIELVEKHDRRKLDAPSGTSHLIVEALDSGSGKKHDVIHGRSSSSNQRRDNEIGVHSLRAGNLASEHYISFVGADETIEINHKAQSFDIYGIGAIKGAEVLLAKEPGLYSMKDIVTI